MIGRIAALAAVTASVLVAVPGAQAATTLGQLFSPTASTTATVAQTGVTSGASYTVPNDGVITGWTFLADSAGAQVKLKVVRPIDGGQYAVVGESDLQTVAAGQQQTFATRIPVKAGDLVGTAAASGKSVAYTGAQGDTVTLVPGDQPPGTTGGFSNVQGIRVDVTAALEPDADGDGYGDESQDLCTTDATLQSRCSSNLSMKVTADRRTAHPGQTVTLGLTVHNSGPSASTGVQLVAELSSEFELLGTAGGNCSGGPPITCNLSDIPKDGDAVLRMVVRAKATGPATIAARASSATADPDESDNGGGMSLAIVWGAGRCANAFEGRAVRDVLRGTSSGDRLDGLGGNDIIAGFAGTDCLNGGDGNDRITGGDGNDTISGGSGNDRLAGDAGRDTISGGAGNDRISGGSGGDTISAGAGNDRISGGSGLDTISAGAGNDSINVADGKRDVVDCGSGRDSVKADRSDRLKGCERVTRTRK